MIFNYFLTIRGTAIYGRNGESANSTNWLDILKKSMVVSSKTPLQNSSKGIVNHQLLGLGIST